MSSDTFHTNPQYRLTVVDPDEGDEDSMGTLIVAVLQTRKPNHANMLSIGYAVYKVDHINCLTCAA